MNLKGFSAALILVSVCFAQDSTLTLKNVIKLAVSQNTSMLLAKNQIDQKQAALVQEKKLLLPDASASLSSSPSGKLVKDSLWKSPTDGSLTTSYTYTPSSGANIKSLNAQYNAAVYTSRQTVNDITSSAVSSFIKTVYAQKAIAIVKTNLDYQKSRLSQIEEFKAAGKKSLSDVLQQQTAVAEGEASLLTAEQAYGKALLSLYNIAGINIHSKQVVDTSDINVLVNVLNADSERGYQMSLDSVPQILSQLATIQSSEYKIKSAKLAYAPTIKGSASTGISYSGYFGAEHTLGDPTGRLSLSLTYPLFDQYKRKITLYKENLSLQSAKLQLTELERKLDLQYEQYRYDLEIARKQLSVAATRLTAAKQSLDAINERYDAGASTLVEVAMVNSSYLNAVNSQLSAESSLLTAYVNLLQVTGMASSFFEKNIATR